MDNLKETIANMTIYDVKAYVRKAQNAVLNYTEMEAKVREATNNEPWGASSTLMKEIADATNYGQHFHEIMPMIYRRFTEKSASEWRQIYKALQLLEFLVKNGSERVVSSAQRQLGLLEMLQHFHYIDQNGKDQGINIRNRAKELSSLLGDDNRIRSERKKARENNKKYGGIGSDGGVGFGGSGKKYGGFGSDSLEFGSGTTGRIYGDGGGFNGSNYIGPGYDRNEEDEFEEYDAGIGSGSGSGAGSGANTSRQSPPTLPLAKSEQQPVADFISFDDDDDTPVSASKDSKAASAEDDDDFDDFQSAIPAGKTSASGSGLTGNGSSLADLFASSNISTASPTPTPAVNSLSSFGGARVTSGSTIGTFGSGIGSVSGTFSTSTPAAPAATPKPKKDDAFGDLWSLAGSSTKKNTKPESTNLATMAQKNVQQSMWGGSSSSSSSSRAVNNSSSNTASGSASDDLLTF